MTAFTQVFLKLYTLFWLLIPAIHVHTQMKRSILDTICDLLWEKGTENVFVFFVLKCRTGSVLYTVQALQKKSIPLVSYDKKSVST